MRTKEEIKGEIEEAKTEAKRLYKVWDKADDRVLELEDELKCAPDEPDLVGEWVDMTKNYPGWGVGVVIEKYSMPTYWGVWSIRMQCEGGFKTGDLTVVGTPPKSVLDIAKSKED